MTRTALVFALLLYSPAPLSALPQSSSATHDQETIREVVDLERQSKEAAIRRDVSFVERTLAEDYVGIGPLGAVVTKADTVAARKAAQLHYDSIEISEMVVRLYGNTAVVTARAEVKGSELGEDFSGPYRFTRVWVKRNGHWQTVSYQATVTR
ncbi:MAG: nuclear transport factor 2 family protein, partial [Acidobacteriia bacterium]|nr:nuclear transport factor 2 family protein [Terriglobia bacterium]